MARTIQELQSLELAAWEELKNEDWLENIANKLSELRWLLPKLSQYGDRFRNAQVILEIGAGEGWASCIVKYMYPHAHVIASDISATALSAIDKWQKVFDCRVDKTFACKSYSVPLPSETIDVIFCFQAAHHFVLQKDTLAEVKRLLRPGGQCFYLHEPSCPYLLHPLAKWRVNRKRPECPEDLLVYDELQLHAHQLSLGLEIIHCPVTVNRGVVEGVYYKLLSALPVLPRWLPCTSDFLITREI